MKRLACYSCLVIISIACISDVYGQKRSTGGKSHKLQVFVCTEDGEAISGIVLCRKGEVVRSEPTDGTGMTFIDLTDGAGPGDIIDLVLVQDVIVNRDWEIPPGNRTLVHKDKPSAFSPVMLRSKAFKRELEKFILQPRGGEGVPRDLQDKRAEIIRTYTQLGHYHYSYGRFQDAIDAYTKALNDDSENDDLLYSIALTLSKLDKDKEALPYIEKGLAIRKTRKETLELAITYENYALLLIKVDRKDEAERQLAIARRIREREKATRGGNQ